MAYSAALGSGLDCAASSPGGFRHAELARGLGAREHQCFQQWTRAAIDRGQELHEPSAGRVALKRARTSPSENDVGTGCGAPRGPKITSFASLAGTRSTARTSSHCPTRTRVGSAPRSASTSTATAATTIRPPDLCSTLTPQRRAPPSLKPASQRCIRAFAARASPSPPLNSQARGHT